MLRYSLRLPSGFSLLFILALQFGAITVFGQTDPAAQALPFSPDFSTLTGTTSTYPAGFQGWGVPGTLSTAVLTAAPTSNQPLFTGQTNAATSPFVGDMVNKIGLLSGASAVKSLCMAVNTSSVTTGNVQLIYTVATQGQTAGGFIDELDLQYRVGTSGSFTTVAGATYQNDGLSTTTTATTTAYNPVILYVTLPAACTNHPVVELRWIPRNVSGSGTVHPSFSISNITVQAQTTTEYYSAASGNMDNVTTWGTNTDGSGSHPANFAVAGIVLHTANGNPGNLSANWVVSGANSKIIVDRSDLTTSASKTITATIDVNPLRTLTFSNIADSTSITLGNIDPASTVIFSGMSNFPMPVNAAYGNIIFNNTTIETPAATEILQFAGNFILQGASSFVGGTSATLPAVGISLVTVGSNDQAINANGLPLVIYDFNVGFTNPKSAGTVSLAPLTTVNALNHFDGNMSGSALFVDNGNIIEVGNNLDLSGSSSNYNITGTIWMNGIGSGTQVIRGGSGPCVAAVNNIIFNSVLIKSRIDGGTFTVKGTLTITDTATKALDFNGGTLYLGGNFINRNPAELLSAITTATIVFNGSGPQSYYSAVTGPPSGTSFNNVTMNNSSGLTLSNAPVNVNGTLTLTSGLISTGSNFVNVANGGSVSGGSSSSYVKGALSQVIAAGTGSAKTYEVGDTTYSPVNITFPGVASFPDQVMVRSTYGPHPAMATSYINTSNYVNRYWTVTDQGGETITSGGVNVSLSYSNGDMTGASNANYTIRKYLSSAWTTPPSITNVTTGAAPLLADVTKTTGVAAASFSGDYVAGNVDCATSAGSATVSPSAICGSGTAALGLSGVTSNTGNSYQWQSSPNGTAWTAISGATQSTYTGFGVSATTYYMCTVGCIPTTTTLNSTVAIVTVNPLPTAVLGATSTCMGSSQTLSDASGGGTWSSANTSIVTIGSSSGTYTGVTPGTTTVTYTLPTGCYIAAIVTDLALPTAPTLSSSLMSFCTGSVETLLTASADTVGGTITSSNSSTVFVVPKNFNDSSSITITGIPPGATITGVSVNFKIGASSTAIQKDNILNLRAPNGNKINLINASGGTSAGTGSFNNVTISSSGTTPIMLGTPLVPGNQYIASLANNVGATIPAGYKSNTTSWSNLYSIPNGKWTFITDNTFNATEDTFRSWSITINYVIYPALTWSPVTGLYTTSGGTAYTGTATGTIYVLPASTTIYTVTTTSGYCSNSSSITAVFSDPLYVPVPQGAAVMCQAGNVTLTDSLVGGTWSSGNTSVATVGSASGIVTGTAAGTAVISYAVANGSCSGFATRVVTVTASPPAILGNMGLCVGALTVLSDAVAGTWSVSNANATIGTSGIVTGITAGLDTVVYTSPIGCATTGVVSVNAMPVLSGLSASSNTLCAGGSFTLSAGTVTGTGSPVSYNWTGPAGYSATGVTASITVTPAAVSGSGIYSLTVTYPGVGCTSGTAVTSPAVTVNAIPTVAGISSSTSTLCTGGTFTLTAGAISGTGSLLSYNWSGPNGFSATGTTASTALIPATTAASGIYSVTVTYPGSGCTSATSVTSPAVTVNALPSVGSITSSAYLMCPGATFTLTAAGASGAGALTAYSWSGPNGYSTTSITSSAVLVASTTAASGVYSVSVSYSGVGCTSAAPVVTPALTVNALPTIGGVTASAYRLCIGGSITLTAGGTSGGGSLSSYNWSGPNGYNATGTTVSVAVTPSTTASSGIYSVTVTYPGLGCVSAASVTSPAVTVNALPTVSSITSSTNSLCAGGSFTLTAGATAGVGSLASYNWSGPNGYTTTSAVSNTVVSGTTTSFSGIYSLSVTYPGPGCTSTVSVTSPAVTVNVQPAAITGSPSLCNGTTTLMSDTPAGGAWTSSNTNISIDGTGNVTGLFLGTSTVSYTIGSCYAVKTLTVNASPPNISGMLIVCRGATSGLSDPQAGGTWASSNSNVNIDGSGNITGNVTGTADITYSLGGSCNTISVATVNSVPTVSGVSSSSALICTGGTFTLTAGATTGTGSITSYDWSGPNSYAATSAAGTEAVTPATTAASGIYSVTVNYPGAGCVSAPAAISQAVTVNPLPSSSGVTTGGAVCYGATASLFANSGNATSWSWTGPGGFTSTVQNPTLVPTATATYSLSVSSVGTGCSPSTVYQAAVTVNPLPGPVSGVDSVYIGSFVTLSDDTTGGSWTSANSNVTVGSATGVVNGLSSGTAVITYILSTGCTANFVVTVLAVPPAITGTLNVCPGSTIALSDIVTGGTWTSSNSNATIGAASGIVTGVTAGTSVITYTFPSSTLAVYATVTVDPLPSLILGVPQVCVGLTTNLTDTSSVGSWSASNGNASIGGSSGVVTGMIAGTDMITYTLAGTGCAISEEVTVNALPSGISGTHHICLWLSTSLSDATPGGTWSSSNGNVTVGSTGVVSGMIAGTSTITYELPTGCVATSVITVNPLPGAISGLSAVCVGSAITLSDPGSGSWSASNLNVTINASGVVTGVSPGTSEITYTLATGCITTMPVSVNPIVVSSINIVEGSHDTVCAGTMMHFTTNSTNGGVDPAYQWALNGSAISGATNSSYSYIPANSDTISVMLTPDTACALPSTVTSTDIMTVLAIDTSAVYIAAAAGDTVCQGANALFTATAVNGGSAPVFIWSVNGSGVASGSTYSYIPVNNDHVICTLVSDKRCIAFDTVHSNEIIVRVDSAYIPVVEVYAIPGATIGSLDADTFIVHVVNPGPPVNYQWYVNSTLIAGATTSMFMASYFANDDSVSCTVTGAGQCGYTSFNAVKLHVVPEGVHSLDPTSGKVSLIPNPNTGHFMIKGVMPVSNGEQVNAEITDMLGQVVYSGVLQPINGVINEPVSTNDLSNGMYLLNLRAADRSVIIHFVIAR